MLIFLISESQANIIRVPTELASIQKAIDASANGDTVIVSVGEYHEKINFKGKNILIGSEFVLYKDSAIISSTIIDGDGSGTVVTFDSGEDSTAILMGVTIQNGRNAPDINGSGIWINNVSNPTLRDLIIQQNINREGGGILCEGGSKTKIYNSIIRENQAVWGGAAVTCMNSSKMELKNVIIENNTSESDAGGIKGKYAELLLSNVQISNNTCLSGRGGGINLFSSKAVLSSVTISYNQALDNGYGGGIFCSEATVVFDPLNRCNVFLNKAQNGQDLYSSLNELIKVTVDTFTVIKPTQTEAYPLAKFQFDILHSKIILATKDLYISPDGDDSNSGSSPDNPLKTVSHAIFRIGADSQNPHTIHLADGVYSPSTNGEVFPLVIKPFLTLKGSDKLKVILDAELKGGVFYIKDCQGIVMQNMTIQNGKTIGSGSGGIYCEHSNLQMQNVIIQQNESYMADGGGMFIAHGSEVDMTNVLIRKNKAGSGGGIFCWWPNTLKLKNVIIQDNSTRGMGGGICTWETIPIFDLNERCSIYGNSALTGADLYAGNITKTIHVVVDTFSVSQPTSNYAYPLDIFTFDILHSKNEQIDHDLYVSPEGSDDNNGMSPATPLRTITYALNSVKPNPEKLLRIFLKKGLYSPSSNGEQFPLRLLDNVSLIGESQQKVVLSADKTDAVLFVKDVQHASIENLTITGGDAQFAGGIYCENSSPLIKCVTVINNIGSYAGGIGLISNSNATLFRVTVAQNKAYSSLGIWISESNPLIINATVIGNQLLGDVEESTAAIEIEGDVHPYIINSIVRENMTRQVGFFGILTGVNIFYSNIEGGWTGEGNIDADPLFVSPDSLNFSLLPDSPCRDAGVAMLVSGSDTLFHLLDSEYYDSAPDMGAREYFEQILVYPGDTDNNGYVDEWDIISIGLCFLKTGPVREVASIKWTAQIAQDWTIEGSAYADSNGDGEINELDVIAIGVNWGNRTSIGNYIAQNPVYDAKTLKPHLTAFQALYNGLKGDSEPARKMRIVIEQIISQITPVDYRLYQNYPNPFNSETNIRFHLPKDDQVTLKIFNLNGQLIDTLLKDQNYKAGSHQYNLNADQMTSGIYFYTIETSDWKASQKMIVLQ